MIYTLLLLLVLLLFLLYKKRKSDARCKSSNATLKVIIFAGVFLFSFFTKFY